MNGCLCYLLLNPFKTCIGKLKQIDLNNLNNKLFFVDKVFERLTGLEITNSSYTTSKSLKR